MSAPGTRWPDVLLVAGPAGSGKTTLAATIARAGAYVLCDLDQTTGPLTAAALRLVGETPDALDLPGAGRALRSARYASLVSVARANLDAGHRVVVAAPFSLECTDSAAFASLCAELGVAADRRVALAYLDTPTAVRRDRLRRRGEERDRTKLGGDDLPASDPPCVPHLRLSGGGVVGALVEELSARLGPIGECPTGHRPC